MPLIDLKLGIESITVPLGPGRCVMSHQWRRWCEQHNMVHLGTRITILTPEHEISIVDPSMFTVLDML